MSTLELIVVFIILVFVFYQLFDRFMKKPLGKSVEEEIDENQLSTTPIANVWGYYHGGQYKYRWMAIGRNEGYDNFNSEEEAIESAEYNGYDVDLITD